MPTLPVHSYTAKQPPRDTSPRRRGKSSYSPALPTQERAGRLSAKNKSRYSIEEFDAAVTIQRFRRNLRKRRLKRLRLQLRYRKRQAVIVLQRYSRGMLIRRPRQRFARTKQLLRHTSDYTKLLQSQRGGNRRPPPTPFETPIGANVKSVLVTLVVGILPMLQILYWIVGGFRGVYLMTLLTSPSSLQTLMTHPPIQCVCL